MKENSNKAIVINSTILYVRLGIVSICNLFITRFALQALGVTDFGLFSVLGSIIAFISIINTIMVSTSHRYIAVSIGIGDISDANKQFNICLIIHIVIALICLLIAFPLGDYYIYHFLNYTGDIFNAKMVFRISVLASIITFIGVPYNGLLTAKENFLLLSIPDIISHILKLIISYLLISHFSAKLLIYTICTAIFTAYPTIVYYIYCRHKYPEFVKFKISRDISSYKEIFSFSAWVAYGAVTYIGKSQGAALLVNAFFNTVMNTALGIANSINSLVNLIAQNIARPIAPQITKSYAVGNYERSSTLLVMSTKLTYLFMFLVASPFLVNAEWILGLWLKEVPPYAEMFTILIIIDALVDSLNSGIKNIIFASGKIKLFQVVPSTLKLLSVVAAYFVLKEGFPAYSLLYAYICFSIIIFFVNQWILHVTLDFNNHILIRFSYIPCLLVTILFIPYIFIPLSISPLFIILIGFIYLFILIYYFALSKKEKMLLSNQLSLLKKKYLK